MIAFEKVPHCSWAANANTSCSGYECKCVFRTFDDHYATNIFEGQKVLENDEEINSGELQLFWIHSVVDGRCRWTNRCFQI